MNTNDYPNNTPVNLDALTAILTDLAELLTEETEHVDALDVKAIAALQPEKQALITSLEKQQKIFTKRNYAQSLTLAQRTELAELYEAFESIAAENQHRLVLARKANAQVIEAITAAAKEKSSQAGYDQQGSKQNDDSIAFSLNQSI